jgi:hypothetical protein
MTMHPRYISKSDFPDDLLRAVGLRSIGSRPRSVKPESWGIQKHPEEAVTEDIFVAGSRVAFANWAGHVEGWSEESATAREISHIEDLSPFQARDKLRSIPQEKTEATLELVLHNAGSEHVIQAFLSYASRMGAETLAQRRRDVKGLTFIPVRCKPAQAEDLARFTFVRVARGMPSLRPLQPSIVRSVGGFSVDLPTDGPVDTTARAVIFDGGIPTSFQAHLSRWVNCIEPTGIGASNSEYEKHGLGVTTAFLFGSLKKGQTAPRPICPVDHVRVLDAHSGAKNDLEILDVLDRIIDVLDSSPGKYQFVNISLGPNVAITDDEVTQWTATLDQRLAMGRVVATVAAGNDGELDEQSGANRIQPPADGVNVLSVGAADAPGDDWKRADYSCVGPGRSPGVVKPDGLAFGGSNDQPFMVLSPSTVGKAIGTQGTSFASPLVLRSAAAVHAGLGYTIGALATRGLLIHRATSDEFQRRYVGWGRFVIDPEQLVTCDDDEALVVYQGELPVGEHLRAPVPLPIEPLRGDVFLTATLIIAPEVDPEYPGAYTRSGLEVSFRPHSQKFTLYEDGSQSTHPKTTSFFSVSNMYGASEYILRDDGHKWEPCLRNAQKFRSSSLFEACFDIYYHQRSAGSKAPAAAPIPYGLIVSLKAPKVADLYNQIVRSYSNILVPILHIGVEIRPK